ncbi:HlyD family secretion protein [Comamonas denitrificans]|jgi:HlyD family secretion protein|uniref:HlyD family secretion protein n=1 Tax=Comamonas denitrificans TaxID=117506 RepID=UPI001B74B6CB|nr:HlyD family efflux transporter periplasmic adaptor subunit [Acidovorax sp.]HRL38582.1 HlyD family efflux transporter periplasmic adaptor subunit [Comamonas denitrificans]HRM00131.1 HlyD family efflux transporter periplasmic adaptor subunit [Acidovorax sp.]
MDARIKKWIAPAAIALIAAAAYFAWNASRDSGPGAGFVQGNGRIEATEIDIATKLPGRLAEVLAAEGDFVQAGTALARMDVAALQAQRSEAVARHAQAQHGVATAHAQVALRESDLRATQAQVALRESELDAAQRRLARSTELARDGASSQQELDDDRARQRSAQAGVTASKAQVDAARAAIQAARTQVTGAEAQVAAAQASIERIDADLHDATLTAPRDGRVQFRIAQEGEVLGAGGRVLNLVDLSDVYMTFFLPETAAGRVAIGSEARIILDAAPHIVIPATISFVSATAQFTPKTVETASERQKLMFRVRAQIDRELLARHLQQVKTGLPGVTWVKLDANTPWPATLQPNVPQ